MNRKWEERVQTPVAAGSAALRTFLHVDPPNRGRNDLVVQLLEYIYRWHTQNPQDQRFVTVFAWLRDRPSMDIAWYGVFQWSIQSWDGDRWGQEDPVYKSSPITRLIWDNGRAELYDRGAIYACAEFGLDALLSSILTELRQRQTGPRAQAEILFRTGPSRSQYTPLGIAIFRQQVNCINTLVNNIDAAREFVAEHLEGKRGILGDDDTFQPLVHQTLVWARQAAFVDGAGFSVDRQVEILRSWEPMLHRVIGIEPKFLSLRNKEG